MDYMDDGHSAFSKSSWMSGDNSEEINMQLFSSMGKCTKAKFFSQIMLAAASINITRAVCPDMKRSEILLSYLSVALAWNMRILISANQQIR